jgi:tripeptidyl-peptidase-1
MVRKSYGTLSSLVYMALIACSLTMIEGKVANQRGHKITFALKHREENKLKEMLLNISNPLNKEMFRKYLTHEEVTKLVEPIHGSYDNIMKWIHDKFGQHIISGDLLYLTTNIQIVQSVFNIAGSAHETPITIVPMALKDYVYAIYNIVEKLPRSSRRYRDNLTGQFKGIDVNPQVLYKQYKMEDSDVGGRSSKNAQGVAAFEDAEFKQEDVNDFQIFYNLPSVNIGVVGPNNGGYFGEAGLDTQYITASGRKIKSFFISHEEFNLLDWCEEVLNMTQIPQVLSVSWGGGESQYPISHQTSANNCFLKLGSMGVSIFAASGDDGTGKQGFWKCKKFDPTWPASSPWVTSVGATYINSSYMENGWDYSGGGFSCNFDRPSYQNDAIEWYLNSTANLPDSSLYCKNGRGTPDISAVGTNFLLCSGGCESQGSLSGTSASTPTIAGMISVINDMLLSQGKPPVGFINPLLYQKLQEVGFDVVTGNNKQGCPSGFPATKGWDAMTGVGTPLFDHLKNILIR